MMTDVDWLVRGQPPAGATGLLRIPGESAQEQVTRARAGWASFSRVVHTAVLGLDAWVGERLPEPRVSRSYTGLTVRHHGRDVNVLFHINLPVLALAEPETAALDWPFPRFVDDEELSAALTAVAGIEGLTLLLHSALQHPIERLDLSDLSPHERRDLDRYHATTLGHLLFNYID